MNPILEQIYATVIPSAPYVIAAYVLMWLCMCLYIVYAVSRQKKVESQLAVVEKAFQRRMEE